MDLVARPFARPQSQYRRAARANARAAQPPWRSTRAVKGRVAEHRRVRTCASAAAEQELGPEEEDVIPYRFPEGIIKAVWRHGFWRGLEFQLELGLLAAASWESQGLSIRHLWYESSRKEVKQITHKAELLFHGYVRKPFTPGRSLPLTFSAAVHGITSSHPGTPDA
jgi:hypothetical protein